MSERTEDLLGTYREPGDLPALHCQVETLQNRHAQLLVEQSELVKQTQAQ